MAETLVRNGVSMVFIAPGSRSAPLVEAIASHAKLKNIVHVDERGLGYLALGYAKATRKPVAIVTTSGTAVGNLLPAVMEASMASVPLLVMTADRPPEVMGIAANQTVKQQGIFGEFVRWFYQFPAPDVAVLPQAIVSHLDYAIQQTNALNPGPVHLNFPFREPLIATPESQSFENYLQPLRNWLNGTSAYTTWHKVEPAGHISGELLQMLKTQKGLIFAGELEGKQEADALLDVAQKLGFPVIADVLSGLPTSAKAKVFPDLVLADIQVMPEVVLWLGKRVVSKRMLTFLDKNCPKVVQVFSDDCRVDPVFSITHRLVMSVSAFSKGLAAKRSRTTWSRNLVLLGEKCEKAREKFLLEKSFSELAVVFGIAAQQPGPMFLANSLTVRNLNATGLPGEFWRPIFANRGVSGIDGNIATACGLASGLKKSLVAVIGDLAALHDLNSLSLMRNTFSPVKLVIINNNGGAIFATLPSRCSPVFETHFSAPQYIDFSHTAAQFNLPYFSAHSTASFKSELVRFLASKKSAIFEVFTKNAADDFVSFIA